MAVCWPFVCLKESGLPLSCPNVMELSPFLLFHFTRSHTRACVPVKSKPSHVKRLHILLTLLCQILISLVLITEKGTFGPVSMNGGVATANEGLSPGRFGPSGVHTHPLELAHEIVLFSSVNYSSVCKCFGGNKTSAPHTRARRCPGWLHYKT